MGYAKPTRSKTIDRLRGLAVFLVLWGHAIQYMSCGHFDFFEDPVFRFIYSFHMPLFMAIAGYLFYNTCQKIRGTAAGLRVLVKKVVCTTLYPLVLWSTIKYLLRLLQNAGGFFADAGKDASFLHLIAWDAFLAELQGPWFLWSIVFCSLAAGSASIFLSRIPGRPGPGKALAGHLLAFALLALLPGRVELCKDYNVWMYPYFSGGLLFHQYKDKFTPPQRIKLIALLSLAAYPVLFLGFHKGIYIYTSGINPFSSEYGFVRQCLIDAYRWILGAAGVVSIAYLVWRLQARRGRICFERALCGLGKISLQVYLLQRILLETLFAGAYAAFEAKYGLVLSGHIFLFDFVFTPFIAVFFCALIGGLVYVINRCGLSKLLFGR